MSQGGSENIFGRRQETHLFRNSSDKLLVVRNDDHASVPLAEREHERVETLQIEVVSRLYMAPHRIMS